MIRPGEKRTDFPAAFHLCATLNDCDLSELCCEESALQHLQREVLALVQEAHFPIVAHTFHFFAPHAVTAAVCLAESHLCFHSWPEHRLVYLDIFACSQQRDPTAALLALLDALNRNIFRAKQVNSHWVKR